MGFDEEEGGFTYTHACGELRQAPSACDVRDRRRQGKGPGRQHALLVEQNARHRKAVRPVVLQERPHAEQVALGSAVGMKSFALPHFGGNCVLSLTIVQLAGMRGDSDIL